MMIQGTRPRAGADVRGRRRGGCLTWADLWLQNEREFSRYNFEEADSNT